MTWATLDDGDEIYYEDVGTGPVLVFVSGYMGIADIWRFVIPSLSSRYRCISYDRRGYGRSSKFTEKTNHSVNQESIDLESVLRAASVDKDFSLVAHSMGGSIATTFITRHPLRVSGVVFCSCTIDAEVAIKIGLSTDTLVSGTSKPSSACTFYENFGLIPRIALEAAKWPRLTFENNATALVSAKLGKELKAIKVPTMLIWGDSDVVTPLEPFGNSAHQGISNSRLEVLKGVNHFPQVENPEKVISLIKDFIKRD